MSQKILIWTYQTFIGTSRRLLNKFMALLMLILLFGTFLVGLVSFLKPTSPKYLCSLSANPNELPAAVKLSCGVIHAGLIGYNFFAVWLHITTIFAFCVYVNSTVSTMSKQKMNSQYSYAKFVKRHDAMALLVKRNGDLYKHVLTSFQVYIILIVTLNSYRGIALKVRQSLVFAVTFLCAHIWLHSYAADMNEMSLKMLRMQQGHIGNVPLWFRKFLSSCRPFNVRIGNFFFVDRGLIITVMSTIIDNTVTLLLI